ncbi:MAG: hypothetical protein JWP97_1090 [Labilithrix sp.]|nr:hypothetical protein [Labilithrix sp.]
MTAIQTSSTRVPRGYRPSSVTTRARRRAADARAPLSLAEAAKVRDLRALRRRTEQAARVMRNETKKLTDRLVARGMTVRDIGALLGISYQRVQQIIKGE